MDVKEAIERLKLCSTNQCNICGRYEKEECMLERNRCEKTVLSELEKKDKEIIRLSKTANEYKKAIQCEKCNCSVCEAHINTLELRAELEKKDKIIDEMAEQIFYWQDDKFPLGYSIKDVKEYFTKKCEGNSMEIKTKYEIGQHIWVVSKDKDEVRVYDDYIGWVTYDDKLEYGLAESYNDVEEQEIILYEDKEGLANKIKKVMEEIRKEESNKQTQ